MKFGVKISGVRANSPAEKAGLQAGDVIVRMDDRQIADLQAMTDALRAKQAGDAMRIVVQRAGQELVLHATLR